jgi:hypothetical protein
MRKRLTKQVVGRLVPGGTLPAVAVRAGLGWAAARLLRKAGRRTLGYTAAGVVAASAAPPVARYVAGKLRRGHGR